MVLELTNVPDIPPNFLYLGMSSMISPVSKCAGVDSLCNGCVITLIGLVHIDTGELSC
jgi:hypothetical protein